MSLAIWVSHGIAIKRKAGPKMTGLKLQIGILQTNEGLPVFRLGPRFFAQRRLPPKARHA